MKSILFFCEIGTLILIPKILKHLQLPEKNVLLYALNPLVIIELTGNLHFEAAMIFFVLLSIWLLTKSFFWQSAVAMATAVCVKFLPLIFFPLLIKSLGWRKTFLFYAITAITILFFFIPLANTEILNGYAESLGYYFKKFEFNASIYYVVRYFGYLIYDYNIIQTIGWKLGLTAAVLIFAVTAFFQESKRTETISVNFFTSMLWCLFIYFLFTTTLHPWYITLLLLISVFTQYRFVILWTALIFLTYAGYHANGFHENLSIIAFEYIILLGYLLFELKWKRDPIHC
jgi:hypothetical protein